MEIMKLSELDTSGLLRTYGPYYIVPLQTAFPDLTHSHWQGSCSRFCMCTMHGDPYVIKLAPLNCQMDMTQELKVHLSVVAKGVATVKVTGAFVILEDGKIGLVQPTTETMSVLGILMQQLPCSLHDLHIFMPDLFTDYSVVMTLLHDLRNPLFTLHHGAQQIVWADGKPRNILLDRDGRILLADFGQSFVDSAQGGGFAFSTTAAIAPAEYMSGGECSTAMDMYQLGTCLFDLMYGPPTNRLWEKGYYQPAKLTKLSADAKEGKTAARCLMDVLKGVLVDDPSKRLTADQCLQVINGHYSGGQLSQILCDGRTKLRKSVHLAESKQTSVGQRKDGGIVVKEETELKTGANGSMHVKTLTIKTGKKTRRIREDDQTEKAEPLKMPICETLLDAEVYKVYERIIFLGTEREDDGLEQIDGVSDFSSKASTVDDGEQQEDAEEDDKEDESIDTGLNASPSKNEYRSNVSHGTARLKSAKRNLSTQIDAENVEGEEELASRLSEMSMNAPKKSNKADKNGKSKSRVGSSKTKPTSKPSAESKATLPDENATTSSRDESSSQKPRSTRAALKSVTTSVSNTVRSEKSNIGTVLETPVKAKSNSNENTSKHLVQGSLQGGDTFTHHEKKRTLSLLSENKAIGTGSSASMAESTRKPRMTKATTNQSSNSQSMKSSPNQVVIPVTYEAGVDKDKLTEPLTAEESSVLRTVCRMYGVAAMLRALPLNRTAVEVFIKGGELPLDKIADIRTVVQDFLHPDMMKVIEAASVIADDDKKFEALTQAESFNVYTNLAIRWRTARLIPGADWVPSRRTLESCQDEARDVKLNIAAFSLIMANSDLINSVALPSLHRTRKPR